MKNQTTQFAICIDNNDYPSSLEMLKLYQVLPDEDAKTDGDLRVIDESGEDYLYSEDYFLLLPLPQATTDILEESLARVTG